MYVYVRKYTVHHNMIYTMYIIYQNRIFYTLVASQNVASTLAPNHQRNASRLACCACTVFLPAFLASSNLNNRTTSTVRLQKLQQLQQFQHISTISHKWKLEEFYQQHKLQEGTYIIEIILLIPPKVERKDNKPARQ